MNPAGLLFTGLALYLGLAPLLTFWPISRDDLNLPSSGKRVWAWVKTRVGE